MLLLVTTLIYIISFNTIENQQLLDLEANLKKQAVLIKHEIQHIIKHEHRLNIDSLVKDIATQLQAGQPFHNRITLVRDDGIVIADSNSDIVYMDNHIDRPEIKQAIENGYGTSRRYSNTMKTEMMYVAIPLEVDRQTVFVRTAIWTDQLDTLIADIRTEFFTSVALVLILSIIVAALFSSTITAPIRKLVAFAKRLPKEQFRTRIRFLRRDELGVLGNSLNLMAREVSSLFDKLSYEKEELHTIIDNIREGLIVIAEDDSIALANRSMRRISGLEQVEGLSYKTVIQHHEFANLIDTIRHQRTFMRREMEWNDRTFRVGFSYLENQNETIAIFSDITDAKTLEKTKKDFVSSVSHELRTPLTSIKGFVETLIEEEDDETKIHYLTIIDRNTERLINMVRDLLLLAQLENVNKQIDKVPTDIIELINNVMTIFKPKMQQTGMTLNVHTPIDRMLVSIDPYKIEQVFINLIDNAMKYAEEGTVDIHVSEADEEVEIRVRDNGPGIPVEHHHRVFERFYVVNKARSRKQGGTGLGLALVKHIVQLHDGDITINSDVSEGTEFIIRIPTEPVTVKQIQM